MSNQEDTCWNEQARMAQISQAASKPIDWNKILVPKPKLPAIKPLDLRKYEGMRVSQAAQPIIWEVQEKINEIIQRLNA
jgi:hypothetical protein